MQSPVAVAALKRLVNARLRHEEEGQDLLEYGMLVALIALVAIGTVGTLGNIIDTIFWQTIANGFAAL
jgi:Flp pilus assembly pilin Flp